MSQIQPGQRVIIREGLHRGRRGTVVKVRQDVVGSGQIAVDVMLDGVAGQIPYLTSQIVEEGKPK